MRVSAPTYAIPAYVPPVPVVPLSPEVSKALIASGIFQHGPDKVGWASFGPSAEPLLGRSLSSVATVNLPGGTRLHPLGAPTSNDVLLPTLLSAAEQALPGLDQGGLDVAADAVGLLVASPDLFHALTDHSGKHKAENFCLYAINFIRLLNVVNHIFPVPHVAQPLEVVASIFKVGDQVFIAGENRIMTNQEVLQGKK